MIINRLTARKVNAYALILVNILVRAFISKLEYIRIRTFINNRRKNIDCHILDYNIFNFVCIFNKLRIIRNLIYNLRDAASLETV